MNFRAVVGASQGAGPLRMHMAKKLEVKILVAALLFGTIFEFVGFASHHEDTADTEEGALRLRRAPRGAPPPAKMGGL
eukprot:scaffold28731_cov61-Phaeocystis_antarctica.AAC.1